MASNQTPVYGLNQWSLEDGIIMAEFNADNQKTEQALVETNATVAALQQQTEILRTDRTALEQAIAAAKAETKSGDTALQTAINTAKTEAKNGDNTLLQALNAAKATIPHIAFGTYVGTGTGGADNPNTLTFDFEPKLLIVTVDPLDENAGGTHSLTPLVAVRGATAVPIWYDQAAQHSTFPVKLLWNETTVGWYCTAGNSAVHANRQFNATGLTYHYFVVG